MKYTGKTVGSFQTRFQEHLRDFRYGNGISSFTIHLLENGQDIGPIEDIMRTIHITDKGKLMGTLEKFTYSVRQNWTTISMAS
jgi:hypothetical protein